MQKRNLLWHWTLNNAHHSLVTVIFASCIRNTWMEIWNQAWSDRRLGSRPQNHVVDMRMRKEKPHCVIRWLTNQITDCATLFTLAATSHNRLWPVQWQRRSLNVGLYWRFSSCINSGRLRLPVSCQRREWRRWSVWCEDRRQAKRIPSLLSQRRARLLSRQIPGRLGVIDVQMDPISS